jgi:hypothetical protein
MALASCGASARAADEDHAPSPASLAAPATPAIASAAADSIAYAVRILDKNKLGLTLSNYGFIGTNFTSRSPSFEYPLGSGYQHMVRGGPWIGGISADENGAFTGVSTAAVDGSAGSASAGATEFTPATNAVYARSTLPNSRYFKDGAISEMDFISQYSDRPSKRALDNNEDSRPLGVVVTQYNFSWSFSNYAHMVFFHYVVTNDGPPLHDVWLGMYDELASGNMNASSQVPPSGWFSKKQIAWVDSLDLFTERYCVSNNTYPTNCRYAVVPEIAAVKLLGVRPGNLRDTLDKKITLAVWSYAPGSSLRDEDVEKYAIMRAGTKATLDPLPVEFMPVTGDPVSLIAVGPFPVVNSGDSVSVDFAYIGVDNPTGSSAPATDLLVKRAQVAQRAYDLNYLVPVPPPSPRFKVAVREHAIDYYWDDSPESFLDPTSPYPKDFEGYRIYAGENRDDLRLVAQFDLATPPNDTTGFNTGLGAIRLPTPMVIDGRAYPYKFTLDHLRDGFKYWAAVTAYDLGTTEIESLESGLSQNEQMVVPMPANGERATGVAVFPNPYRVEAAWDAGQQARDHYLWFANLPTECTLKIYTLSGVLVYETSFDGATYDGRNARGVYRPGSDLNMNLSGTSFGWDLITRQGQAAATGLYLWAVEDRHGGKRQSGKFLIVKSDRESF